MGWRPIIMCWVLLMSFSLAIPIEPSRLISQIGKTSSTKSISVKKRMRASDFYRMDLNLDSIHEKITLLIVKRLP